MSVSDQQVVEPVVAVDYGGGSVLQGDVRNRRRSHPERLEEVVRSFDPALQGTGHLPAPALDLAHEEPVRTTEFAEPNGQWIDRVKAHQCVDHRLTDACCGGRSKRFQFFCFPVWRALH